MQKLQTTDGKNDCAEGQPSSQRARLMLECCSSGNTEYIQRLSTPLWLSRWLRAASMR